MVGARFFLAVRDATTIDSESLEPGVRKISKELSVRRHTRAVDATPYMSSCVTNK
jgi:hypothetical protein